MNDCDYRYQRWLLVHFVNWGITGKTVYMNGPKSLLLMLWGSLPILSCLQALLQQAHFCPVSVMCLQQETEVKKQQTWIYNFKHTDILLFLFWARHICCAKKI
jgi:hypothetical protein